MAHYLQLLNFKLVREIQTMSNEELWDFLVSRLEQIKEMNKNHKGKSWLFLCLNNSFEWFKERYFQEVEDDYDRDDLNYTLILDFCFEGEKLKLDYYGVGGFYDNPASCDAKKADDVMPETDEESHNFDSKIDFYLLDAAYLEMMIQPMEDNFDKVILTRNKELDKIIEMRELCLKNEDYRVAFLYNEWRW